MAEPSGRQSARFKIPLPHGHVQAVLWTIDRLGLPDLIASEPSRWHRLVIALIAQRILEPGSKLAMARELAALTATSSLGLKLAVEDLTEDDLYEAMDWVL